MDFRVLRWFGFLCYISAAGISLALMLALGTRGIIEIALGLYWNMPGHPNSDDEAAVNTVISAFEGFELLLAAPLPFVIIVSVGRYLRDLLPERDTTEAEHQLHRVKALIVSLLMSIVVTDLVKRFLGRSAVSLNVLLYGVIVTILLGSFFVVLHRVRVVVSRQPVGAANIQRAAAQEREGH